MADRYRVRLLPGARRQLEKLAPAIQHRLATAIDALPLDPSPASAKRLSGPDEVYRLRVGDYRVLFRVLDDVLVVLVIWVGHRGDAYRAAARRRLRGK